MCVAALIVMCIGRKMDLRLFSFANARVCVYTI